MGSERASIFDDDTDDLDLSGFETKKIKTTVPTERVRKVSEASKFTSRTPAPPKPKQPTQERRIYRTGRNVQLNVKADQETIDTFYRIANEQNWVLGETLERAVEALEQSLRSKKKGGGE